MVSYPTLEIICACIGELLSIEVRWRFWIVQPYQLSPGIGQNPSTELQGKLRSRESSDQPYGLSHFGNPMAYNPHLVIQRPTNTPVKGSCTGHVKASGLLLEHTFKRLHQAKEENCCFLYNISTDGITLGLVFIYLLFPRCNSYLQVYAQILVFHSTFLHHLIKMNISSTSRRQKLNADNNTDCQNTHCKTGSKKKAFILFPSLKEGWQ